MTTRAAGARAVLLVLAVLVLMASVGLAGAATAQPVADEPSAEDSEVALPPSDPCPPGSLHPACTPDPPPTDPPPESDRPPSDSDPQECVGPGCIPQPGELGEHDVPVPGSGSQPGSGEGSPSESECSITDIAGCVSSALTAFFRSLVVPGLNTALDLLGNHVLVTPPVSEMPVVGEMWEHNRHIMLACYGMLIVLAGIVAMTYQTMQTRTSVKDVLPRVVLGFLAANLSLFFGSLGIDIANALSRAVLGDGLDPDTAARSMTDTLLSDLDTGGVFLLLIACVLLILVIVVLLTYIVRITLTVLLLVAAPLLLMAHALPQIDGIARWWWKAFGGVLAIQVGQSLTLALAMRMFFWPGGISLF